MGSLYLFTIVNLSLPGVVIKTDEAPKIHLIRRALAGHKPAEAMERLLFFLRKCPKNAQLLMDLKTR